MSPRPRKASDEDVFAAAMRTMMRRSPAELTLADIAEEAGVTAGALVQRFGSKRQLLLTLASRFARSAPALFADLRASHPSPLGTVYAYADCMAGMGESPGVLAHHLSWLQQDLTDPEFRRHTRTQARASRRELRDLIEAAAAGGLIHRRADPNRLARAVEVTVGGSLIAWAIHQEGTARAWVRHDLDALLDPWLTARGRRRRPALPRARRSGSAR